MGETVVREYNEKEDKGGVEELEKQCEIGSRGKPSLLTDLMGDPICRVRNSPSYIMLVAEYGDQENKEVVGVIRGCIKTVSRGKKPLTDYPIYVKVAYILGLRVSSSYRRLGLGTKLVSKLEEWFKEKGAEYAYMATDCANQASINLFTLKCAYVKFRTPTILVHPVHAHYKPIGSGITVVRLSTQLAESIYRRVFSSSEFFPKDIDVILSNKLNLGTFMALPKNSLLKWDPQTGSNPPQTFAILSVWNTKEVFKLQVKGVSALTYACCVSSRMLDAWMPWLRIPSIPDLFSPFGVYSLYGLHMEGKGASRLMKSLCAFVHNIARDDVGCGAIVAEVGRRDPVREAIPHWRRFSWAEDVWCMKNLTTEKEGNEEEEEEEGDNQIGGVTDWIRSRPSTSVIFVDPRDF
ncbi:GNAT domain [Macleaya cordata]|uniref:GNAT domain n=1 Tax=Macleaya cordata TaxID=56857 RepID=A0A200R1J8_MACCD|nr:GNAT domain [Macleaya cordata]